MKKPLLFALIFVAAAAHGQDESAAPAVTVGAQVADKTGGYGAYSPYESRFNPKTVISFTGRISGISVAPPRPAMEPGVVILVKAANGGVVAVDLGPNWFIEKQAVHYEIKDLLKITGSKVMEDGHGLILASRVIGGGYDLKLRDEKGLPVWDAFRVAPPKDLSSRRSITGIVTDVQKEAGITSVQTEEGNVKVMTGPLWFQERQSYTIQIGDSVTFYAGPTLQVGQGIFVTTDVARIRDGYILIGNNNAPVWISTAPPK